MCNKMYVKVVNYSVTSDIKMTEKKEKDKQMTLLNFEVVREKRPVAY